MADHPGGIDPNAIAIPAPFINYFQVTKLGASLIRIAFAEGQAPLPPSFRSAVLMGMEDARQLRDLLAQIIDAEPPSQVERSRPN